MDAIGRRELEQVRMKYLICLAVLMAMTTSAQSTDASGQEIRKCKFDAKAGCVFGEADVTLADGVVKRVEVDVNWCGPPVRYQCMIDSSRSDGDSIWSEDGGVTLIANASPINPNQPDRLKVTVGRYVSIDLDEAQTPSYCGFGAELPRAIVIRRKEAHAVCGGPTNPTSA
jgi:hypothetical protein